MPFRRVSHKDRVEAVKSCIKLENIKEVAKEYGISESTLRRDYEKILDNVEQVIPKGSIDALKKKLSRLWSRLFHRGAK